MHIETPDLIYNYLRNIPWLSQAKITKSPSIAYTTAVTFDTTDLTLTAHSMLGHSLCNDIKLILLRSRVDPENTTPEGRLLGLQSGMISKLKDLDIVSHPDFVYDVLDTTDMIVISALTYSELPRSAQLLPNIFIEPLMPANLAFHIVPDSIEISYTPEVRAQSYDDGTHTLTSDWSLSLNAVSGRVLERL